MRITSGIMMRQYNSRLNEVLSNLNDANERVTNRRKYQKASENPSESVKSLQLRREYLANEDYQSNLKEIQSKSDSVESSMMKMSQVAVDASVDLLGIVNGTNSQSDRKVVAAELREMQKTLIMDANAKYGDQHLFGGSSTQELPFVLKDDGTVTYRGINVDTTDPTELAKLQKLSDEKIYVDLGFGLTFDTSDASNPNTVVASSAFNTATPGIKFLGFGQNADGTSKNLIVNLGKIADELEQTSYSETNIQAMSKALDVQKNNVMIGVTQLGSNSMFLDYTLNRLEDNEANLNSKLESTEFVTLEEAISDFKMQDTTYRAVLKMGTDILSVSFMDFMK